MSESDITISYETIFDILRREKERSELQPLPATFVNQITDYVKSKQALLRRNIAGVDDIVPEEKAKVAMHLQNVRKMLRDLYNRRESKIMVLAQNKVRTNSSLVDTEAMLEHEEDLFNNLSKILEIQRRSTMKQILTSDDTLHLGMFMASQVSQESQHTLSSVSSIGSGDIASLHTESSQEGEESSTESEESQEEQSTGMKLIRFVDQVPKFVGRDLQTYGPFQSDDIAHLPEELARLLLQKGKAEEVVTE